VSLSDVDQHIRTLDLHRIDCELRSERAGLAGLWIPSPAMPRTDHFATFDHALAKRAAAMKADVIHGADFAIYIGDANRLLAAGEFFGFVRGGKVGLCRNFRKHSVHSIASVAKR
jgi:hypothetical protein